MFQRVTGLYQLVFNNFFSYHAGAIYFSFLKNISITTLPSVNRYLTTAAHCTGIPNVLHSLTFHQHNFSLSKHTPIPCCMILQTIIKKKGTRASSPYIPRKVKVLQQINISRQLHFQSCPGEKKGCQSSLVYLKGKCKSFGQCCSLSAESKLLNVSADVRTVWQQKFLRGLVGKESLSSVSC